MIYILSWTIKKHQETLSRPLHSKLKKIQGLLKEKWNSRTFQGLPLKFKDCSRLCKPCEIKENCGPSAFTEDQYESKDSKDMSLVEIGIDMASRELTKHKQLSGYQREHYSVANLSTEVIRIETGLPTKEIFHITVNYVARFKENINYYSGWKVEAIALEDQVFLTLMKLKQNYTNLHLAQLFSYSVATVTYKVLTSFKVIIGVAPNPVITYVSDQYPGSVFDKCIVHFVPGDMILADQGFLIQDLLTKGVSMNISPFLNCGKFTE